jgi:hypothetical protein
MNAMSNVSFEGAKISTLMHLPFSQIVNMKFIRHEFLITQFFHNINLLKLPITWFFKYHPIDHKKHLYVL